MTEGGVAQLSAPTNQTAQLPVDKKIVQRLSGAIAFLSLVTLAISFYFIPNLRITPASLILVSLLGILFFFVYVFLPQIYLHETFLLVGDALYIAIVTFVASRAGEYGVLILFLYFVVIVADALKYSLSEYVIVVLITLQAAFFYIIVWSPFSTEVRIGILTLFTFCTFSIAIFMWYFVAQTVYERSVRYILERKSQYLKDMNDHLQAVDVMRDNMVRVASHEFQTPLSAIKNSLALLRSNKFGAMTPKQLELLQLATQNNERLTVLVHNLLDTARIQSGKWELHLEDTSLTELITQLVTEYQSVYEKKQQTLTTHFPSDPMMLQADPSLILIACKNLIDNAIKYTPEGGAITLTIDQYQGMIRLIVADTGIGIKKEILPHLFSQFYRSDSAIAASPNGYGIGLYYSRLIIQRHKGDITVQSVEGKGSTFTVTLPTRQD